MTLDQIFKLVDAGFTKDEIMALSPAQQEPTPQEPTQQEPTQQEPAQQEPAQHDMSAVMAAIKATNDNIAKLALMQGVKNVPAQETAEDILPKFIRV